MSVPLPFSSTPFPPPLDGSMGFDVTEPVAWSAYQRDFPANATLPEINGDNIQVRRAPHPANPFREHTYWHMVTHDEKEGVPNEALRRPDINRLVRIPWARPLLESYLGPEVKRWREVLHGRWTLHIWHTRVNYILVLREQDKGLFLITSFCPAPQKVTTYHTRWSAAKKARHTF